LFSLNLNHDLTVGISIVLYITYCSCLACTRHRHAGGDIGITKNTETKNTRKCLTAMYRQYWRRSTNTEITHQPLLQLVTVMH